MKPSVFHDEGAGEHEEDSAGLERVLAQGAGTCVSISMGFSKKTLIICYLNGMYQMTVKIIYKII